MKSPCGKWEVTPRKYYDTLNVVVVLKGKTWDPRTKRSSPVQRSDPDADQKGLRTDCSDAGDKIKSKVSLKHATIFVTNIDGVG